MRLRATFLGALTAAVLAVGTASAPSALAAGSGQIDGTITDTSGAPISTCVYVYDASYSYAGSACTDPASGAYVVDGLSDGTAYRLDVQSDGVHAEQWFDGATGFDAATDVVAPGTADVVVQVAGTISGVLTNADGSPVTDTHVSVYDTDYNSIANAVTWFDGSWSTQVPAGDYKVEFTNWPTDMWYRQAFSFDDADVVSVASGASANADTQLISQGAVTGTVTDAATGAPSATSAPTSLIRQPTSRPRAQLETAARTPRASTVPPSPRPAPTQSSSPMARRATSASTQAAPGTSPAQRRSPSERLVTSRSTSPCPSVRSSPARRSTPGRTSRSRT
jgi:hypothetical protein